MDADKSLGATFTPETNDTYDNGDSVKDSEDAFPLDIAEWLDTDGDGTGDNADTADDGDGLSDEDEINILLTNPKRTVETGIVGAGAQIQRFYSTRGRSMRYFRVEEDTP